MRMAIAGEKKMASQYSQLTRHDLEAKIVRHSWDDEAFRKEFIADPAGAFVKYLSVPAAALPKIAVHQEEPGSWHIVLPAKPVNAGELSEVDLERVAGGITTPITRNGEVAAAVTVSAVAVAFSVGETVEHAKNPNHHGW
jgi:hypothetical protein